MAWRATVPEAETGKGPMICYRPACRRSRPSVRAEARFTPRGSCPRPQREPNQKPAIIVKRRRSLRLSPAAAWLATDLVCTTASRLTMPTAPTIGNLGYLGQKPSRRQRRPPTDVDLGVRGSQLIVLRASAANVDPGDLPLLHGSAILTKRRDQPHPTSSPSILASDALGAS